MPTVKAAGQRLSYQWDVSLNEWFVNDRRGLEHGFTVAQRPEGQADAPLAFTLGVRGGLRPAIAADALGVAFQNDSGTTVLNYSGLKVWDADGKVLASRFVAADEGVRLLVEERGARYPVTIDPIAQQALITGSNTTPGFNIANRGPGDAFGRAVAISGDTVVIGAPGEDSNASGVNGNQADNSLFNAGAAYVFVRSGDTWTQQAYLKASNPGGAQGNFPYEWQGDNFGQAVAIAGDTIVIGAPGEDGRGLADPTTDTTDSGAAYVFVRSGTTWTQQAYLKVIPGSSALFGGSVAISGETIVVGTASSLARIALSAPGSGVGGNAVGGEGANNTGVNAFLNPGGAPKSGAAYVFVRSSNLWKQQAYLKASNTDAYDGFGQSVSISGDTLVVGAWNEASAATGVNGDQADNSSPLAGAAYVFARSGGTWTQQAYLKADSHAFNEALFSQSLGFGYSVSISGDTVVVGAPLASYFGLATPTGAQNADKVFVFTRSAAGTWTQQAAIPATILNPENLGVFGLSVAVSGETLVIGDPNTGSIGRALVYTRTPAGAWLLQGNLNGPGIPFAGYGYAVALSGGTAVSAAGGASEDTLYYVYIKGDNRAQIFTGVGLPRMSVEQPAGSVIASGGARTVATLPGSFTDTVFTIRNVGAQPLTLTGTPNLVALSGSSDFSILTQPASPVAPGATTTFTVRFAPATAGLKTATLTIPSDDASTPYVISLSGRGLSTTTDTDGDGLSDAAEFNLASLGFDWQVSQPAQVSTYFANANSAGLYTTSQVQTLNVGTPLLQRDAATGQFTLELGLEKSNDLQTFTPFPFLAPQTSVQPNGKLHFQFTTPDNAAFFRLKAQ